MAVSMAALDLRRKKKPRPQSLKMVEPHIVSDSMSSPPSPVQGSPSPANSETEHRHFSLQSIRDKAWKPFTARDSTTIEKSPSTRTTSSHGRRLSKSRNMSVGSSYELINRRSSGFSEDHARMSIADSLSTTSSSIIDWKLQNIYGFAPLEPDSQLLKTKQAYLIVTTDYIVKVKCHAHMLSLFPQISGSTKPESTGSAPEPLLVIPVAGIVSAFVSESPRPSFGAEIWWRTPSAVAFHHTTFFFSLPTERNEQLQHIVRAMSNNGNEETDFGRRPPYDISEVIRKVHEEKEPMFKHQALEIFPVVPRGLTRKDCSTKAEENGKKSQEGSAFYLVVGAHLCHLIQVHRGKGGEAVPQSWSFGLVSLETFKGDWVYHQERFNITFRDPFKPSVTLELASRYYRYIIRVFGTADRFLRPLWPLTWHTFEVFRISGLKEPQYLTSKEDFGSVKRTLDAYLSAYNCGPVEWEINWKTRFAPEFRLLPVKPDYTARQLLAVLRALRYNDYFNSLSFRDVDLSVLWGLEENEAKRPNVAYLSRSGVILRADEIDILRASPILHQEFHALAYCSETIRHIDFTNTSKSYLSRVQQGKSVSCTLQYLTPILNLLRFDITRCTHLNLSLNLLSRLDIQELSEAMREGQILSLDVSCCGLDDMGLRDVVVAPILDGPKPLESLNISGNSGRLSSYIVPQMLENLGDLRELNMHGSLKGGSTEPLFLAETLMNLRRLEALDISKYHLNAATIEELERFLYDRARRIDQGESSRLRKLVFNHCGITGTQAARLLRAIGEDHGLELSLSGNPLERGMKDMAAAIADSKTPAGLIMDMVEFDDESNYILLIKALCKTKHLSLLSLVGTAPTPDPHEPCNPGIVQAFTELFTKNTSIRCLDISGFSDRLEDGQLSKGFGSSLTSLIKNKTLTHLRIRSQKLHEDAGTLGRILKENKTLVAFDCQDNEFNFTSLQFLVSCLKENTRLLDFPFGKRDRRKIWQNILEGLHIKSNPSSSHIFKAQEALLADRYAKLFQEIDGYILRNRKLFEEASWGQGVVDFEGLVAHNIAASETVGLSPPTTPPVGSRGVLGGNRPLPDASGSRTRDMPNKDTREEQSPFAPKLTLPTQVQHASVTHLRRATVHSSDVPRGNPPPAAPYHVGDGTESPTDTLDPVSEVSTPPLQGSQHQQQVQPQDRIMVHQDGSGADDLDFQKLLLQFKETGFDY
ncbi:RNI-like protein [Naviculisporaceae sp. PSN 640]